MTPRIGVMKFQELKAKAYDGVWNSIMDAIAVMDGKGVKNVSIKHFPPYTMVKIADELMEAGYDTVIEIGEYSGNVTVHIAWG